MLSIFFFFKSVNPEKSITGYKQILSSTILSNIDWRNDAENSALITGE